MRHIGHLPRSLNVYHQMKLTGIKKKIERLGRVVTGCFVMSHILTLKQTLIMLVLKLFC